MCKKSAHVSSMRIYSTMPGQPAAAVVPPLTPFPLNGRPGWTSPAPLFCGRIHVIFALRRSDPGAARVSFAFLPLYTADYLRDTRAVTGYIAPRTANRAQDLGMWHTKCRHFNTEA